MASREAAVASREASVASREASVASTEASLGFAQRQGVRRRAPGGSRAPGAGRREVRIKSGATAAHTHTHGALGAPMGPTSDCYPALREDKRTLRFAQSRSAAGAHGGPMGAPMGPRAQNHDFICFCTLGLNAMARPLLNA